MNSSTSDSELSPEWSRCLVAAGRALFVGAIVVAALMVMVDPYDSDKLGLLGIRGVVDRNPFTADASRARDPRFDSAIFGTSTGQLIDPDELAPATGAHFAQLITPGADPRGQLAVVDFFERHHQRIKAVVMVLDDQWCATGLQPLPPHAFPFWLYDDGRLKYLAHLFNWPAIDRVFQRMAIGLGARKPLRADGFWSYEEVYPADRHPIATEPEKAPPFNGRITDSFPLTDLLDAAVRKLPADTAVILLMPPTFYTIVPQPGSQWAAVRQACKARLRSMIAGRAHSNLIDYRVDNALTRDPRNFVDLIHIRAKIARKLEQGIIESLKVGEAAKIDF